MSGFSLSKASRFYETGVRSSFGEELVESGFPSDAVRLIEGTYSDILSLDVKKVKGSTSKIKMKSTFCLMIMKYH